MHLIHLLLTIVFLMSAADAADKTPVGKGGGEFDAWIESDYRANTERFATAADVLVERGLLADRKHRYVDLLASATGAGPDAEIVAFIAARSDDPPGALAVTPVRPAAIQAALEFIGMSAGHPLDIANGYYWPKGDRVSITFYWDERNSGRFDKSVPAELLVRDTSWNTPLPELGFRFVGSSSRESSEIATAFNATNTVLEVPYRVDRNTVRGNLVANGDYQFAVGEKLRIRLRPESRNGGRRVYEFMLDIQAGSGVDAEALQNLHVTLAAPDGEVVIDENFEAIFVYLTELLDDGNEPFLQLRFSDSLSAGSIQTIARFVQAFLIAQDIRFDPNDEHLSYASFLPRFPWRDPTRRIATGQPVEVHLEKSSGEDEFRGEIVQYQQANAATSTRKQLSFGSAKEFADAINQGQPWNTDGVFLFVSPDAPYAEIRQAHEMTRALFPIIYVFL